MCCLVWARSLPEYEHLETLEAHAESEYRFVFLEILEHTRK